MKWIVVLLACFSLASLSAQQLEAVPAPESPATLPAELLPVSEPNTPPLSTRLRELATRIEQATTDSASDWETLSQEWTSHLKTLDELATLSADSEREMRSIKASREASERLRMDSIKEKLAAERRERIWRGVAVGSICIGITGIATTAAVILVKRK